MVNILQQLKRLGADLYANHSEQQAMVVYDAIKEIERLKQIENAVNNVHSETAECWCMPEIDYVDPVTGVKVYVHKNRH